ncbi:hypothetical protein TBLA_0D03430 [Henningerozyma blattae CBS 6284]|uniref:Geranylgeranyl transferase type-2 subunit alpha n=1 Tax=Henningerozyma blattae (strain ATCC 34711 / CBS 6284 / DSM 70876 / NBRC 10599 / NRRL Y-10934 / UCD 77-7) TaxID=1071380 RepID=I2H391_HENB6|nr:hypothetical protein TBLA_0D03430 [Tetrapisispora blattae CBS 6284]CCH60843.1 hypothetical protein TBLA_0D03430 [Tetrapisispora blattae CBS 6284]
MHGIKRRNWSKEQLELKRKNDAIKIKQYKSLNDTLLKGKHEKIYDLNHLELTETLLKQNPEFNTIWNYRRSIILSLYDSLDIKFWQNELYLLLQILKDYPKVYWIWNYRLWILQNYPKQERLATWENELKMVYKLLDLDSRNFHAWHYKRVLTDEINKMTDKTNIESQFIYSTTMINKDISNFSAWHQRTLLLPTILKTNKDLASIEKEVDYIVNAMFTDPEDQSIWYYMNWFINNYTSAINLIELKEKIEMINNDELEFSGKENIWCLKLLINIEKLTANDTSIIVEYLTKLIQFDYQRANRYKFLLEKCGSSSVN